MISPSTPQVYSPDNAQVIQDKDDKLPENPKGEFAARTVEWLSQLINYSGMVAMITALASITLIVRSEEPKTQQVGEGIGNFYVVVEVVLVVAVVSLIALKFFMKLRS